MEYIIFWNPLAKECMSSSNRVKRYYGNLQNEAVHQLRNEQGFYGGVAFGNWLNEKGLPENLKEVDTFPRER